ncbi:nitroreductase [Geoalkalibacter halelectricus]|uniref:Nitroreductase n=1 Tax=Geoalkalibacter halelectricus TaxID=2847045 RepID=A0ABY5ZHE8_9BACT|nr:nitroreductase [Geoalkalibacter halelectricus]MDO3379687.1 nitroreductase [Geoalkalibacter halelectricus]UWZ78498.1 nitroreductase [Geoalkalibacter halelectricus]
MKDQILKVLELAVAAPSGDNCQPWKLVVEGPRVRLYNLPEKDTSLYNFEQRASLIAHGSLLENLDIAAPAFGLKADIRLFPEADKGEFVAEILFEQDPEAAAEPLFESILKRNTNRREYEYRPMTTEAYQALLESAKKISGTKVYLSRDDMEKNKLSDLVCQNDRLVFENPHLHRFLFDHIRFTPEEVARTADGMDLRSFELPAMDRMAFGLLKSWKAVQIVNSFGFLSKKLTKQANKLCRSASAIGLVTIAGDSPADFVNGGRAMERVWLEATRQGLQLHPMAGLGCLIYRIGRGGTGEFSQEHISTLRDLESGLRQGFGCGSETLAMLFRVGYAAPPSAPSVRKPLDAVVEVKGA